MMPLSSTVSRWAGRAGSGSPLGDGVARSGAPAMIVETRLPNPLTGPNYGHALSRSVRQMNARAVKILPVAPPAGRPGAVEFGLNEATAKQSGGFEGIAGQYHIALHPPAAGALATVLAQVIDGLIQVRAGHGSTSPPSRASRSNSACCTASRRSASACSRYSCSAFRIDSRCSAGRLQKLK